MDTLILPRHVGVGGDDQRRDLEAAHLIGEVEVLGHGLADLVQQPGKSSGCGATRWYSWYIGVSFMNSAAAVLTWPCCARISG